MVISPRALLYHATRHGSKIMSDGVIHPAEYGDKHVSLTTSFEFAEYWSRLDRDDDDGYGTVFVLDRASMEASFYPLIDFKSEGAMYDEFEVACSEPINIKPHLVGVFTAIDAFLARIDAANNTVA